MELGERAKGRILNIQHFCMDDGPGIRTVVFLKGCPLKCVWCHNPESQAFYSELMYRPDKCVNCMSCVRVCPGKCHRAEGATHVFAREDCKNCGMCSSVCEFDALSTAGIILSVEDVMEEILSEKVFYEQSGGGITLSGGEPLAQPDFSMEILKECREAGIHTCVETCGFAQKETLRRIAEYTDLFLFDYKLTDDRLHREYTGADRKPIMENLRLLKELDIPVILRCPMIPGINLEEDHYMGIAATAQNHGNILEIQLEPYHPLGVGKNRALGKKPEYARTEFLEKKELEEAAELIRKNVRVPVKIN